MADDLKTNNYSANGFSAIIRQFLSFLEIFKENRPKWSETF
jgi:hypothetical protein